MTGFGAAEGPVGPARLKVEIRTVNHRHLNTQFKLPATLQPLEHDIRECIRARIERGHVGVAATWAVEPDSSGGVAVDVARARALVTQLTELGRALGLPGVPDLAMVARLPGVITVSETVAPTLDSAAVLAVLNEALDRVVELREREGAVLAAELAARLAALAGHADVVEARAPLRVIAERDRLRQAVAELLDGRQMDETRLAQEIALLAERLDIREETVRLRTHLEAARNALGEKRAAGRELSFLGQEMLREINTIGSKANDADVTRAVIAMKGEVEQFREQVENIE